MSGFVENYDQLLVCRTLLGFFEAGHWPCGIKTVRALLDARGRAMGNGVLQSGTSIGAIATPLIMSWLLTDELSQLAIAVSSGRRRRRTLGRCLDYQRAP